jgi:membrane protein DedA with SNARE-associated domain
MLHAILERIGDREGALGLALIAACTALEYVFPPFPGDVVMVFAAFLVAARGWHAPLVLTAMVAGSIVGGICQYGAGLWLSRRQWAPRSLRGQQIFAGIQAVSARFRRHGAAYMTINRFLPGLRSFFWLTAGYVRMPPGRAIAFGGLSAVLWSGVLLGLGYAAGDNRAWLERTLATYGTVAWAVVAAGLGGLGIRWWVRRRRPPLDTPGSGS